MAGGLQSAHGCRCLQENGDSAKANVTEHPWRAPRNAAAGRDEAEGGTGGLRDANNRSSRVPPAHGMWR